MIGPRCLTLLLIGFTLAAAPSAQAAPWKGQINLSYNGRAGHGYRALLSGQIGTPVSAMDFLTVDLYKRTRNVTQDHSWSARLTATEVELDRAKASIKINAPLGPGGTDGEFTFTVSGTPQLKRDSLSCGAQRNVVSGALAGVVRIEAGDHFFKTVNVTRLTGYAEDSYEPDKCKPVCEGAHAFADGSTPFSASKPTWYLAGQNRADSRDPARVDVSVFEPTAGTPFFSIAHTLSESSPRPVFMPDSRFRTATLRAPRGPISGHLKMKATGPWQKLAGSKCASGSTRQAVRPAKVLSGTITAVFDSIGTITLGKNLNPRASGTLVTGGMHFSRIS